MPQATQWSTVRIRLPKEMIHVDTKTGRVSLLVDPLTKSGGVAHKGGEPSIQLETDPHIDKPEIVDEGRMIYTQDAKGLGHKYKGQIKGAKEAKGKVLDELMRDAGGRRPRLQPVDVDDGGLDGFIDALDSAPTRGTKKRRPRLQPVDVDDGGLDGWAVELDTAPTQGTPVDPFDNAIRAAMNRLDADLQVASRRHDTFEELRGIGQAALSRIHQDPGVEEHKSPESHEMLRQRQEQKRAAAFEGLKAIGKKALKKQANAENYAANRGRIREHRNERVECECGDTVMRTNMARHLKSRRHADNMIRR